MCELRGVGRSSAALLGAVGTSVYFGGLVWAALWLISFFSHALYLSASLSTFHQVSALPLPPEDFSLNPISRIRGRMAAGY